MSQQHGADGRPHSTAETAAGGVRRAHPVRATVLLVVTLAALVAAFVGVYLVFVTTRSGQYADERALVAALRLVRYGDAPELLITALDNLPAAVGIACGVGVLLCMIVRKTLLGPLVATAGGLLAILLTQLLKREVLERPSFGISEANVVSFPSGHTTVAAAGVMALLLSLGPGLRPIWGCLGAFVAGAAGLSTVALGWHRPSDVVGALLLVTVCGLLAASVVSVLEERRDRHDATGADSLQAHLLTPFGPGVTRPAGTGACVTMSTIGLIATVTAGILIKPLAAIPDGPRLRADSEWTTAQDPVSALGYGLLAVIGVALTVYPLLGVWASRWARPSALRPA
ncbi:MAG: phosphatase PAP2 family protein [Galactobacter sp.]|uniref:phosphatase PAP2 family protein n=1 Tax=Galactobacter sp. TaxID=2676125 RepID=UPI0025BE5198|nr:phosphatase PAP2 family protein [Galactobacter sp.]